MKPGCDKIRRWKADAIKKNCGLAPLTSGPNANQMLARPGGITRKGRKKTDWSSMDAMSACEKTCNPKCNPKLGQQ